MSDFWYGVRRGRCSISIALTKLDFNVHAVSACIRKQCHGRRKELDYCNRISRISWISIRDSYAASVKKERLFSQSKESLQGTTSFNLALQHRSQRDRKLKADNPLGPSTLRQCTWSSVRALTYGTINIVTAFFQRGEAIDHWRCLI